MKVLHLTTGTLEGGAAKGAVRLHQGLLELGVDSTLAGDNRSALQVQNIIDTNKLTIKLKRRVNASYNTLKLLPYKHRDEFVFSTGQEPINVFKHIDFSQYDILNLHWINYSLGLEHIKKLSTKQTVVWTMRDMWPFTGGCHYSRECIGYKSGCGNCVQLNSRLEDDLSAKIFEKKKASYQHIHFVSISNWLKNEALRSGLFRAGQIVTIYNAVDTKIFKPIVDTTTLRKKYLIDTDKRVILAGAQNLLHPYKGGATVRRIVRKYRSECYFLFFGYGGRELVKDIDGVEYVDVGYCNELELCELYNVSDMFLMLSSQEAFGKTVIEAMACGTPVCVLDGSGPKEIVELVGGGVIIQDGEFDLALGEVKKPNVSRIQQYFSNRAIAKKYLDLYKKIL